jgi:fructokinase
MTTCWGGIEAGGTKFVCAVSQSPPLLDAEIVIPTTTPDETIARVAAFFRGFPDVASLGIGSFGPLGLDPGSPAYGTITHTPKEGWQRTPLVEPLRQALGIPVAIDTDVNAALWGEHQFGALRGHRNALYLTVGTGIGGGALVDGRILHGGTHPEMGHQRVPQPPADAFPGVCPFHGGCWEGLASGPALERRWGMRAESLSADHAAWDIEAKLLAAGLSNLALVLAPTRIALGGGVGLREGLRAKIIHEMAALLSGYVRDPSPSELVVPPALGARAGVIGALELGRRMAP